MGAAFVFEVVLVMITGSFGVIGNCMLIKMFAQLEQKVNFHQLMITLAIFDSIYILLCMLLFAIPEILEGYFFCVAPYALAFLLVAQTGSVYCTVGISLERYLTVCHPFYFIGRNWSARRYIIPIVLFSVLFNLMKFFEFHTIYIGSQEEVPFNLTQKNEPFYGHAQENDLYNGTSLNYNNYSFDLNSMLQNDTYTPEYMATTTEDIRTS